MSVHFSATITGAADTTAPFLRVPPGAAISDPLTPFVLWASEPLSAGSTATLVGSDGSRVSLVPQLVPGDVPVVVAFSKPAVVLEPGLGYGVDFSGITDLAGNQAAADSTLRFASFDAAPLAPPDGFESATGASVGGAVLVRTGPGIPISGMASAYIGQFNSPAPDVSMPPRPRLTVRLAVPPGATKLAFSYRQLAEGTPGFVEVGSVGRAPTAAAAVPSLMASEFSLVGWGKEQFDESSVATAEVPLPSDVDGEVVVGFQSPPVGCNAGFGTPGLLLDDLRLE
jgi:hypothetical protein